MNNKENIEMIDADNITEVTVQPPDIDYPEPVPCTITGRPTVGIRPQGWRSTDPQVIAAYQQALRDAAAAGAVRVGGSTYRVTEVEP